MIASYYTDTIIQHTNCDNYLPYYIGSISGIYLICQMSSLINFESAIGGMMVSLGQKTMPIMIFNWAAFGALDAVLATLGIELGVGIVYWVAQVSIAITLPIIVDCLYASAKSKITKLFKVV